MHAFHNLLMKNLVKDMTKNWWLFFGDLFQETQVNVQQLFTDPDWYDNCNIFLFQMLLFGRTETEMQEFPYGLRINKQSGLLVQPDALQPYDQYNRKWRANYHTVKM